MRVMFGGQAWSDRQFASAAKRLAPYAGRKSYTGGYLKRILEGQLPYTNIVLQAVRALLHDLDGSQAHPPQDMTGLGTIVRVAPGVRVVEGALVLNDSLTCICGVEFIPTHPNQRYHIPWCRRLKKRPKNG